MLQLVLIIAFISLVILYYFQQKARQRREEAQERRREKMQELLDRTLITSGIQPDSDEKNRND